MISLRDAREKVINILGSEEVPAHTTLRGWANRGIISGIIEGNTQKAKYSDIVVSEILAAIELKGEYKLSEIAEIRSNIGFTRKDYYSKENYIKRLSNYIDKLAKEQEKLLVFLMSDRKDLSIKALENKLSKNNEINKKVKLVNVYIKYIRKE